MNLRFSAHKSKHADEKWNQETIKEVMDNHQVTGLHFRIFITKPVIQPENVPTRKPDTRIITEPSLPERGIPCPEWPTKTPKKVEVEVER